MKAFTKTKYGGPEVLQFEEVAKPVAGEGQLLVKINANSANPADWHILRGEPILARFAFGLFKPNTKIAGADFAGTVEEVGKGVTQFKAGDAVFGSILKGGAFAEYVAIPVGLCAKMPDGNDFPTMAAMPIVGLTALQALVTFGKIHQGESVLINGSSGGVGHLTVQIAKAYGASVTAVCSSKNIDFVKSLGADQVIAYDRENIHQHAGKYDLVIDIHGNLKYADYVRMGRRGVSVGYTSMGNMMSVMAKGTLGKFPLAAFTAQANSKDLETLAFLVQQGKIRPHIEKTYSSNQIPEAIAYIEAMHTRGKVVMVW